ncbi:MAG: hypothetical protein V1918_03165, partial [Planctomycetota bacterium]
MLFAGASEIDITPPPGVEMAGHENEAGGERIAQAVLDPLHASALVLNDRHKACVLCAVDLFGVTRVLAESLRRRLEGEYFLHLTPEQVLLAATRTLSAPALTRENTLNRVWLAEFEDRLVRVIYEAIANRRPARAGAARGIVHGLGLEGHNPETGPADPALLLFRVEDAGTGKPLALVVNHALASCSFGLENRRISADFPGALRRFVQEKTEGRPAVLVLTGACGEIHAGGFRAGGDAPRETAGDRASKQIEETGRLLGEEALRLSREARTSGNVMIHAAVKTVRLPLKTRPTTTEAAELVRQGEARLLELENKGAEKAALETARQKL